MGTCAHCRKPIVWLRGAWTHGTKDRMGVISHGMVACHPGTGDGLDATETPDFYAGPTYRELEG